MEPAMMFFLQMACKHSTRSTLAPWPLLWTNSQAKFGNTSLKPMRFNGTTAQWGMMGVLGRIWGNQAGKRQWAPASPPSASSPPACGPSSTPITPSQKSLTSLGGYNHWLELHDTTVSQILVVPWRACSWEFTKLFVGFCHILSKGFKQSLRLFLLWSQAALRK